MRAGLIVALWAVAAVLIMSIVALPISLQAHLVAGLTVVACMIIIKFLRAQGIWRLIALALGTAIVLRYVFWRTTSTIPPITEVGELHPGLPALSGRDVQRHDAVPEPFRGVEPSALAQGSPDRPAEPADRRHLRPELQRGLRPAGHHARRREGHDLSRRQDDGLASGRRRHGREVQFEQHRSRPAGARTPRRAAGHVRVPRREIPDPRPQRACQGRQPQQRPRELDRRSGRRLRCRPRPGPQLPHRDGRVLHQGQEPVPGPDAALLHQSRPARAQSRHVPDHAVRERDVLRRHPARPRQVGCRLLLRLGRRAPARGPAGNQRLQRRQHHRGLRDRARAPFPRLDERLCGQAAHRRPAAGQLRQLHRPALALGARHDADPALQVSAPQARAEDLAAPVLHVEQHVLAVPVLAVLLPRLAAVLPVLLARDLHRIGRRVLRLHVHLHDGELHDAELSLWPLSLAVDLGSLRIHPDDLSACRPCSR